ncbi:MAG TPA: hypothetical protein DDW52_02860 [Planctomycetaceae bacterium]|nr:hypothetical protein [Planctomycetaceae bacterium]
MKTNRPESWIRQRVELSDQLENVPVDVTERVLSTLAGYNAVGPAIDKTPLVLGGSLLALAASIMLVLLPSLTMMTEPWISFWLV